MTLDSGKLNPLYSMVGIARNWSSDVTKVSHHNAHFCGALLRVHAKFESCMIDQLIMDAHKVLKVKICQNKHIFVYLNINMPTENL